MTSLLAGAVRPAPTGEDDRDTTRSDRALIVVGLPGDDEHEALFRKACRCWQVWLTESLDFPAEGVRVLFGSAREDGERATREAIAREVEDARGTLTPEGRFWVFVLGHANEEEGHASLHLPGPDLRDDEFAALFQDLTCREQVFWVTTAGSGWFLPALSAKGRVVIAATERDKEFNETEFPHALAEVVQRPSLTLDVDGDGRVSVAEVFTRTVEAVEAIFVKDRRAPTEHAQLDDNGDGVGTERLGPSPVPPDGSALKDGALANKVLLPAKKR